MWRILTASFGAGGVSGHRMIGVIPGGGQRQGQQNVSVFGARCVAGGFAAALAVRMAR